MPRTRKNAPAIEESFSAEPLAPAASAAPASGEKAQATPDRKLSVSPDPREWMTVTLGPSNADPRCDCSAVLSIGRCRSTSIGSRKTSTS